jgi:mannose-6-phosphate isomerase
MTAQRTLLVDDARFALERIELQPNSVMMLDAERETWLLVLNGDVCTGSLSIMMGEAIFAQYEQISLKAGARGATVLMARTGSVISQKEKRTESIQ